MDNWIFLFLGLILAYLLEFTSPWVKSYFDKSALSSRRKRIQALIDEYRTIMNYKKDTSRLILASITSLAYGIMAFSIAIAGLLIAVAAEINKPTDIGLFTTIFAVGVTIAALMV